MQSTFRHVLGLLLISTSIAVTPVVLAPTPAYARELPGSFADLVEKLSPAVVNISTTQKVKGGVSSFGLPFDPNDPQLEPFKDFFEQFRHMPQQGQEEDVPEREVTSLGSGFILDASGYVVTCNHVIEEAADITVTLSDNTKYKAKVIGRDKKTDVALLKIESKKPLPFVSLGDSDAARVGDWVIAIGNPFGLGGSVTAGIISARQRSINAGPFDDFLQTDASINRGNSGGPLFNAEGKVVGINSAIFSPSGGNIGIGFAVPVAIAKPVIDQLKQFGRTHRGWLGVKIQEVSDEVAESLGLSSSTGALVIDVSKDSPAGKAGVQTGDVITQFDGKAISEMRFLPRMVAETPIGKTVAVTVWRKGKTINTNVTLGELDEKEDAALDKKEKKLKGKATPAGTTVFGLQLAPLTAELRKEYHIEGAGEGLLVLETERNSEALKRGLRAGDVIAEANNEPVKTAEALKKMADAARKEGRKFVLLKVLREKDTAFITLPVAEEKK